MPEKLTTKERLQEITSQIETGIKDLFQSDKYKSYLSTMSRFHTYSLNNALLIHIQYPDASLVAGYQKWQKQFSRHVLKGEKAIKIIAPTPHTKKVSELKIDEKTKRPVLDQNGKPVYEEKEIKIPMFRVVSVFDVSQTEGKPLPELVSPLQGSVQAYQDFMAALQQTAPVPMDIKPIRSDTDGYFSPTEQRITIRAGMSEVQTVCAAIHEITHSMLHNKLLPAEQEQWRLCLVGEGGTRRPYWSGYDTQDDAITAAEDLRWEYKDEHDFVWSVEVEPDEPIQKFIQKDRATQEVEAESVAYAVCKYFGIETAENSFGYIGTWSSTKELPELRSSLETINKTASTLITGIEQHLTELTKNRQAEKPSLMEQLNRFPPKASAKSLPHKINDRER